MIKYAVEYVTDELLSELDYLLKLHWNEIAMYKDKIKLNPNYEAYKEMDKIGSLHIVTVRDDNKLIGYYISFIIPHPHYQDCKFAHNDILFIHPTYRGSTVAYRMFKFAEKSLKELGCSVMIVHMKVHQPFKELCQALDMDEHELSYSKYIGED